MLTLYKLLTMMAGMFAPLILRRRTGQGKEDPTRRNERLGHPALPRPAGHLVWIHAASIGESVSILPLIERLVKIAPDISIMVTTGTVTAAKIMADRLPPRAFHQYVPLDTPWGVKRFLAHWRPDFALFVEQELWPNLITQTAKLSIPMILVNGRLSERSARKWQRVPPATRKAIFGHFDFILTQDEFSADRFTKLTDSPVHYSGNLKYAAGPLDVDAHELEKLQALILDRPVWLAASVHPGEEDHICAVHKALQLEIKDLLTIIVPRHADKATLFAGACRNEHLVTRLRSQTDAKGLARADILIGNTMGEMGLYYRLSNIVFMGGSLVPHGGQNPLEPARIGSAILYGPHIENFIDPYAELTDVNGAVQITNGTELAGQIKRLIYDPDLCKSMAAAAQQAAQEQANSLDHIMERIGPLLIKSLPDAAITNEHST